MKIHAQQEHKFQTKNPLAFEFVQMRFDVVAIVFGFVMLVPCLLCRSITSDAGKVFCFCLMLHIKMDYSYLGQNNYIEACSLLYLYVNVMWRQRFVCVRVCLVYSCFECFVNVQKAVLAPCR